MNLYYLHKEAYSINKKKVPYCFILCERLHLSSVFTLDFGNYSYLPYNRLVAPIILWIPIQTFPCNIHHTPPKGMCSTHPYFCRLILNVNTRLFALRLRHLITNCFWFIKHERRCLQSNLLTKICSLDVIQVLVSHAYIILNFVLSMLLWMNLDVI